MNTWIILVGAPPQICVVACQKLSSVHGHSPPTTRQQVDMAMAASATASGAAKLCYSVSQHRHSNPASKKPMDTLKFVIHNPVHLSRTRAETSFPIRALDPQTEEEEEKENDNSNGTGAFTSPQVTFFPWVNLLVFFLLPIISLICVWIFSKFQMVFLYLCCIFFGVNRKIWIICGNW